MIKLIIQRRAQARAALRWRRAQARRCRAGDHAWRTVCIGTRSDFCECIACPATGYRIKETS